MNRFPVNSSHFKPLVALTLIVSMTALTGCLGSSGSTKRSVSGGGGSGGASATSGTVAATQLTTATATRRTILSPVSDLADNVVDPDTGLLAPVTSQLDALTSEGAPLAPVGELSNALLGDDGAVTMVLTEVNGVLVSGKAGTGSINDTQKLIDGAAGDLGVAPLAQTTDILLDPKTGYFRGLTGTVDAVTGTRGALEPVGDLTETLVGQSGALAPVTEQLGDALADSPLAPALDQLGDNLTETNGTLSDLQFASLFRTGSVTDVQNTTDRLLDDTALEPAGDLVDNLIQPGTGVLGGVTTAVEGATSNVGPLVEVGEATEDLIGANGSITPVVGQLNEVIRSVSADSLANGGGLTDVVGGDAADLADLEALLGSLSPAELDGLLAALEGGGDLSGLLAGLDGGEGLTTLLDTLGSEGLTTLLSGLADGGDLTSLLGGLTEGGDLGGLLAGLSLSGVGDLGTAGSGSITDVNGTVNGLLGDTALSPAGDLVSGVVNPLTGALEPLTGPVDALTSPNGALAPVGDLTNTLIGPQDGVLTPVVDSLNGVIGGADLQGGTDGGLGGLPIVGGLLGQ